MFEWKWDFTFEILPRMLVAAVNTLLAAGFQCRVALNCEMRNPTKSRAALYP